VIEPGEGIGHAARENRSGLAFATSRERDAGFVSRTEPDEASVQVISAVGMAPAVTRGSNLWIRSDG
jgi:hypothetical protein